MEQGRLSLMLKAWVTVALVAFVCWTGYNLVKHYDHIQELTRPVPVSICAEDCTCLAEPGCECCIKVMPKVE
jgi:hypothetical protein